MSHEGVTEETQFLNTRGSLFLVLPLFLVPLFLVLHFVVGCHLVCLVVRIEIVSLVYVTVFVRVVVIGCVVA